MTFDCPICRDGLILVEDETGITTTGSHFCDCPAGVAARTQFENWERWRDHRENERTPQ